MDFILGETWSFTLPVPILNKERKLNSIFIFTLFHGASKRFYEGRQKINLNFFFTLLCGASKRFMKAFKAPFEAPQRSMKK